MISSKQKQAIQITGFLCLTLIILAHVLATRYSFQISLRMVFGSVVVLFLPGFFLSFLFFPQSRSKSKKKHTPDWFERTIFSVFFSLTLITLTLTILRTFKFTLTPTKIALIVILINALLLIGILITYIKHRRG